MKLRHLLGWFALVLVLTMSTAAFAQTGAPSTGLPPVTLPIAVTTVISLLLGLVNMIAQGSILNLVTVPKTWAGPATIVATFLTGVGSFLSTAAQPWTGSTAFYALAFGLFGLFGGALPAFVVHGHTVLPRQIRAMRLTAKVTDMTKAAAIVVLFCLFAGTQTACLSSGPIVPVNSGNQAQVSACQSIATTHNDLVVGGFVLSGGTAALGTIAAIDTTPSDRTAFAISAAAVGAAAVVDTAWTALTSSEFANTQCSSVVGQLPLAKPAAEPTTVTVIAHP